MVGQRDGRLIRRGHGVWAVLALATAGCGGGNAYVPPPPPEVVVRNPERRAVTSYLEYTGTTRAFERVELRARVRGFLRERLFKVGAEVKAGQLLMVIDEQPFAVSVDQARARRDEAEAALKKAEESKAREVAQAQLDVDRAQLVLARIDEARNKNLLSRSAGSREEVDKSEANLKRYEAQVEADRANLEQSKADYEINILSARSNLLAAASMVRNAEIDLGYCRIAAPIDGRISVNELDVGNYVGDGQATVLATIVKSDPIFAYVNVSEDDLLKVRRLAQVAEQGGDPGALPPMEMGLSDEDGYPHAGRTDYTDPEVDAGTGTVRVRGVFANADRRITPGLFVRVRMPLERSENALLVPDRALGADQQGSYLLVVGPEGVVERRGVKPGTEVDGLRVVEGKLDVQDRVVVDGLQRARPGLKVNAKPEPAGAAAGAKTASAGATKAVAPAARRDG